MFYNISHFSGGNPKEFSSLSSCSSKAQQPESRFNGN